MVQAAKDRTSHPIQGLWKLVSVVLQRHRQLQRLHFEAGAGVLQAHDCLDKALDDVALVVDRELYDDARIWGVRACQVCWTQVRIMFRHILPNAISTLVVIATLDIASEQVSGRKPFCKLAIDLCQKLAGYGALALLLSEATQAQHRTEFWHLRLLAASNGQY